MRDTAVFLCNLTMNIAQPWLDAGYHVVMVDPQHPAGVTVDGRVTRIGCTIVEALNYLGPLIRSGRVAHVGGMPPCTDVALSGTRWWEGKRKADPYFQAKAAIVAEQCRMVGALAGCPWWFENPKSAFSRIFGAPSHKFHPADYTGWEADDNYTKETWLWTGGGFVMPEPFRLEGLGAPDDRIHKAAPTKNPEDRANFRSATPRGFSRANFAANGSPLWPRLEIAA